MYSMLHIQGHETKRPKTQTRTSFRGFLGVSFYSLTYDNKQFFCVIKSS